VAEARVQLSIPSELAQVRFLGVALRAVLAELACSEEQAASLELCLIEAVNNVIEHAYLMAPHHLVEVAVRADAGEIELTIRDTGQPMPEGALARAREQEAELDRAAELGGLGGLGGLDGLGDVFDLGLVAEGGYGLRLITQVMNEVEYRRDGAHNVLTMKMRLAAALPESGARTAAQWPCGPPSNQG
jgi:serine/threonine-protein kinase RsbW